MSIQTKPFGPNRHGATRSSRKNKPKSKIFNRSMKEYQKFRESMRPSSLPSKQFFSKNINSGQPSPNTTNNLVAKGACELHHAQSKGVKQIALSRLRANGKDESKETHALKRKREVDDASQQTHFKAMLGLVSKATDSLGQYSDSSSRLKKRASSNKEDISAISKGIYMVPKDNCTIEGNKRQDEIAIDKEIGKEVEYHEGETTKAKHTLDSTLSDIHCNSGSISLDSFGKDPPKFQRDKETTFENVEKTFFTERNKGQFANSKNRNGPLFVENPKALEDDTSCEQMKKLKQSSVRMKDEEEGGSGNLNHVGAEAETICISKNNDAKVSISSCVDRQFYSCSKPIDKPTWSGIFKTDDKKYVSLDGHLSTKSCEKAWALSTQLLKVVEVKKLARLEVWPQAWEVSAPTGDNIGIYFFPHSRQEEGLEQLVREVMQNDLALRAIIGEAEMLIFPSILLPNHHQTFQRKPYLWGVFKRRQERGDVVEEAFNAMGKCEKEKKQNLVLDQPSHKLPGEDLNQEMIQMADTIPLERHMLYPNKSIQEAEASCHKGPTNKGFDLKAPREEGGQAEATPVNPSIRQTADRLMGFVVRKTPKLDRIIQELEVEGALVFAMQGEMVASWAGSKATATQN